MTRNELAQKTQEFVNALEVAYQRWAVIQAEFNELPEADGYDSTEFLQQVFDDSYITELFNREDTLGMMKDCVPEIVDIDVEADEAEDDEDDD
jgi:hypothetical protein